MPEPKEKAAKEQEAFEITEVTTETALAIKNTETNENYDLLRAVQQLLNKVTKIEKKLD